MKVQPIDPQVPTWAMFQDSGIVISNELKKNQKQNDKKKGTEYMIYFPEMYSYFISYFDVLWKTIYR